MTTKRSEPTSTRTGLRLRRLVLRLTVLSAATLLLVACGAAPQAVQQQVFATPEEAGDALIDAAEVFDVDALAQILGPDGIHLVVTADTVQDEYQSKAFAEHARLQMRIEIDADDPQVAIMSVGSEDWPLPIPLVEESGEWRFDTEAGGEEVLLRRIGRNELTAIEVCLGYVEAQHEYALQKRPGMRVNQYAQRIVSTPGTRDGLAWEDENGEWGGPVGKAIAEAIEVGYEERGPFHGYLYKVLTGQGPAAPLGELDFVVNGAMIGGFALVATPADYEMTGVMTFMVSHDGVVYEQDLGPTTLDQFHAMERFNPDSSWEPVSTQ